MAYAFSTKFDVSNLEQLNRRLSRCPKEAANAVRKSNRKWAAKLRDIIRAKAPSGGSKYGSRHDTPRGAIRRGVQSRATADTALVRGRAPHFIVSEFGGGVRWTNGRSSHGIPIKSRNPEGYFFFPTAKHHADDIARAATDEAMQALRQALAGL